MNRSLDSIKKNMAAVRAEAEGLALGIAIKRAAEFVKRNLEMAGGLGETAQQLGVTTRSLQVYRAMATQVGVTQEEMDMGLKKLSVSLGQARLGAEGPSKAFDALSKVLGVNIVATSKTADDALPKMADALSKVTDPTQRLAVEQALLGRAGTKLDTIMTEGSRGVNEYGKRAEELGMVLSDDVIQQADAAADKMAELNAQLTANIAGAIAKNSGAILGLATSLVQLTSSAINFINQWPRLSVALAGAAAGSKFGLPGTIIGGAAGAILGERMRESNNASNPDLKFRLGRLNQVRRDYDQFKSRGGERSNPQEFQALRAALIQETALTRQATAAARAPKLPPVGDVDLPKFLAGGGGGGKGRTPHTKKDPLADAAERFGIELARIDEDILRVKRDGLADIDKIAAIDKELVVKATTADNLAVQKEVADKHITEAQGAQLQLQNAILASAKVEQISRDAMADHLRENLDSAMAANDNQRDILQAQESIAVSTDERRQLQLSLLDLDQQAEKLKLQEVINLAKIGKATEQQAKDAQDRLNSLGTVYGMRAEGIRQQTRSPLEQYIAENDPKLIGEKVERYMVDQLEYVQHSLTDAITSRLGIKDPLLAGLIDLFIQTNFIQPLAEAMRGASGGGGGFLGSIFGGVGGLFGGGGGLDVAGAISGGQSALGSIPIMGAFAGGTRNAPAGWALVGEDGPELLKFRGGEQVFPNGMLRGANSSGRPIELHQHFPGVTNARDARETGDQSYRNFRRAHASMTRIAG